MLTKPTALLLNGLLAYQPGALTPLAPLASKLEAAGFQVCVDNHFNFWCEVKPDLIIGHSQGGASALKLAHESQPAMVITFDAVRMPPCPSSTKCYNFRSPAYPNVPGATNITVLANHLTMPLMPTLQEKALQLAADVRRKDEAVRAPALKYSSRPARVQNIFRNICDTAACRMYCNPDNTMRPGWCEYYREPEEGYLELTIEQICSAMTELPKYFCPPK